MEENWEKGGEGHQEEEEEESIKYGRRYRIAMVSDFFFPQLGGVEVALFQLSQCLIGRGNKVILITHSYGNRKGIRYMTNGLKVYYLPSHPIFNESSVPCGGLHWFSFFRSIILREKIDIIHGHQAFSTMANDVGGYAFVIIVKVCPHLWLLIQAMMFASTLGLKSVFTDHSLFGFRDASSIHVNKYLKWTLSDVSHYICVSNTSKENTVLRAALDPLCVSVIPNAVDCTRFTPDPGKRTPGKINIVVISRLVYRKGMDLLIGVIPEICRKFPNVDFIIGGDGPKRIEIEEMRENHQLHDRVELLGGVKHTQVREVLVRGDIFLNCSLTEAFCIAIVEAASCGLLVVSTRVGGVPEVLPRHMIKLSAPTTDDLVHTVSEAIRDVADVDPYKFHEEAKKMYNWHDVAARTEKVYSRVMRLPQLTALDRIRRYHSAGTIAGVLFIFAYVSYMIIWRCLEWFSPAANIDIAPDFPSKLYAQERIRNNNGETKKTN